MTKRRGKESERQDRKKEKEEIERKRKSENRKALSSVLETSFPLPNIDIYPNGRQNKRFLSERKRKWFFSLSIVPTSVSFRSVPCPHPFSSRFFRQAQKSNIFLCKTIQATHVAPKLTNWLTAVTWVSKQSLLRNFHAFYGHHSNDDDGRLRGVKKGFLIFFYSDFKDLCLNATSNCLDRHARAWTHVSHLISPI